MSKPNTIRLYGGNGEEADEYTFARAGYVPAAQLAEQIAANERLLTANQSLAAARDVAREHAENLTRERDSLRVELGLCQAERDRWVAELQELEELRGDDVDSCNKIVALQERLAEVTAQLQAAVSELEGWRHSALDAAVRMTTPAASQGSSAAAVRAHRESCGSIQPPVAHSEARCALPIGHGGDHAAMSVDDVPAGPRWPSYPTCPVCKGDGVEAAATAVQSDGSPSHEELHAAAEANAETGRLAAPAVPYVGSKIRVKCRPRMMGEVVDNARPSTLGYVLSVDWENGYSSFAHPDDVELVGCTPGATKSTPDQPTVATHEPMDKLRTQLVTALRSLSHEIVAMDCQQFAHMLADELERGAR